MSDKRMRNGIASGTMVLGLTAWLLCQSAQATLPSYQTVVSADNPKAFLRLNETSGTTAVDSTGNGNSGSYVGDPDGSFYVLGQSGAGPTFGTAVELKPSPSNSTFGSARVQIPNTSSLITATGAFEMWVKMDSLGGGDSQPTLLNSNPTDDMFAAIRGTDGRLEFYNGGWQAATSGTFTTGVWHQVVYTYTPSGTKIYLDTNLVLNTAVLMPTPNTSQTLWVGRRFDIQFSNYGGHGLYDEISFYDHVLTPDQIATHFEALFADVPEPSTVLLLGVGGLLLLARRSSSFSEGGSFADPGQTSTLLSDADRNSYAPRSLAICAASSTESFPRGTRA